MNGTPIIDPMLFYWIDVLPRVGDVIGLFGFWLGFLFLVGWVFLAELDMRSKWVLWVIIPSFILSLLTNFIPSTDAMYKMALANIATAENYNVAKSEGKELVEFFKTQIVDIVKEVEGEKESK